jgi:hypothetical protein
MAVDVGSLNPFGKLDIGIGAIGTALLVFFIAVLILGGIIGLVVLKINNKRYKYSLPLTKKIGGRTIRVATYKARDFPIGKAGDKLWFVKGVKKYISPATLQTAPLEYTHHEREDGEWINIEYPDVDEEMKKYNVKYLHQDMRANRLATDRLLEQRLLKKSFWEKWGAVIGYVIFFLVITVCMVIVFYQWSKIVEQFSLIVDKLDGIITKQSSGGTQGIVPALSLLLWRFRHGDSV